MRLNAEDSLPCRHSIPPDAIERLRALIETLDQQAPSLLEDQGIPREDYDLVFQAAIQSIRGTAAASTADKRRFIEVILNAMRSAGHVMDWKFIGSSGMQDYRVELSNSRSVCIEAKGCPDGNNMTIWLRPAWADEFIIWSQCPESLANHPGSGVWSGIATRLFHAITDKGVSVDAFVFYDGRCGSRQRPCPKLFGIEGAFRAEATDIPGREGRSWMPPPSIYLLPRTVPHPVQNPTPPLHNLDTCTFARALLSTFLVPDEQHSAYISWARFELRAEEGGRASRRTVIGTNIEQPTTKVEGRWTRIRR